MVWFRKNKSQKWHLACYGGSIAECGRNVGVAAAYAKERMELDLEKATGNRKFCQACVNSIKRGREYIKQLQAEYNIANRPEEGK